MTTRRSLLRRYLVGLSGVVWGTKSAAASGQAISIDISNEAVASLEVTPAHEIASKQGDGIELTIADSPGVHPDGLTTFEPCFEVTNAEDVAVIVAVAGGSDDVGADAPVDFQVDDTSIVGTAPDDGVELAADETVSVDLSIDFLNYEGTDISESLILDDDLEGVQVTTQPATDVAASSATLNGELTALENADEATVWFEWGVQGTGLPNETTPETLTSPQSFSTSILTDGDTTYEYRARAEAGQAMDAGNVETFTTDTGGCFITTATTDEPETRNELREFRDNELQGSPVGKALVSLYYWLSPPISRTLFQHPNSPVTRTVRAIVKICASLSERQERTRTRPVRIGYTIGIILLYVTGIFLGVLGHIWYRYIRSRFE